MCIRDRIGLDLDRAAVDRVTELVGPGKRPLLEASGGINLDTIASYAGTGVDMMSVGRLTNSAPNLDLGLDIAAV